jgi:hypothetical protein
MRTELVAASAAEVMMPFSEGGTLTNKEIEQICRLSGVPRAGFDRCWKAVAAATGQYQQENEKRSAKAAQKELRYLLKMVKSTLNCSRQKTHRPGKLKREVAKVSEGLRNLSSEAKELLARQHLVIHHRLPKPDEPVGCPAPVIDPAAYPTLDEQLLALRDLYGVLSTEFVPKRRGRSKKYLERILYCEIALAYALATSRSLSDTDTKFMRLADEIREKFKLTEWSPESIARLIRIDRANDDMALVD